METNQKVVIGSVAHTWTDFVEPLQSDDWECQCCCCTGECREIDDSNMEDLDGA
jgi:hypothetical protein